MEILASLIDSLAWPVTVLAIFFVLRKPIAERVLFAKSIKYKDFEVTFENEINAIVLEAEVSGIDILPPSELIDDTQNLIDISPSAAVLQSWKEIEIAARKKVGELLIEGQERSKAIKRPIEHLSYLGTFIPSTEHTIRELRQLRNQVAHNDDVPLSKEAATKYVALAKTMAQQITAITELPKQKLLVLTLLILEYNQLIDSGKYNDITIAQVSEQIEKKNVIEYLKKKTGNDSDFSLFRSDGSYAEYIKHYNEQLYQLHGGYAGNERRKWGIENSGLCLLVAWTNELIQQGSGWYPNDQ